MDAVLVNANSQGLVGKVEHLGLGYLAATLRARGHEAAILDGTFHRTGRSRLCDSILSRRAGLVGFSVYYNNIRETLRTVTSLRRGGYTGHITLGGHHATFNAEGILSDYRAIDSIVQGEGEEALAELAEHVAAGTDWRQVRNLVYFENGRLVSNPCRPLQADLDVLPHPDREPYGGFLREHGTAAMVSSRGCWGSCTFCSIRAFYRLSGGAPWRARSPVRVVDEMEELIGRYGVTRINFVDDEFIGPGARGRERARQIGEEMLRRGLRLAFNIVCRPESADEDVLALLKGAGLHHVSIGVESWVPRQLALYRKGTTVQQNQRAIDVLERLGLDYLFFLIPADPWVTVEEVLENLGHVESRGVRHAADGFTFSRLMVFKGTALRDQLEKDGLLPESTARDEYLGPVPCDFRDGRVREAYRRWQPIQEEYVALRSSAPDLEACGHGRGGDGPARAWQLALATSAHHLFKRLLLNSRDAIDEDVEALAETQLDALAFRWVLDAPRPCVVAQPVVAVWRSVAGRYEELAARLAGLFGRSDTGPFAQGFARRARRALRRSALELFDDLTEAYGQDRSRRMETTAQKSLARLEREVARIRHAIDRGSFRTLSTVRATLGGTVLTYPPAPIRRLSERLAARLGA